jgi:SPX domain protein involved in polyphosphate accumulation
LTFIFGNLLLVLIISGLKKIVAQHNRLTKGVIKALHYQVRLNIKAGADESPNNTLARVNVRIEAMVQDISETLTPIKLASFFSLTSENVSKLGAILTGALISAFARTFFTDSN